NPAGAAADGDLLEAISLRGLFGRQLRRSALAHGVHLTRERLVFALAAIELVLEFAHVVVARAQLGFEEIGRIAAAAARKAWEEHKAKGNGHPAACLHVLFPSAYRCRAVREQASAGAGSRAGAPARCPPRRIPGLPWPT